MAREAPEALTPPSDPMTGSPKLPRHIEWRVRAAIILLYWERLWPAIWPAANIAGVFLALALFGIFSGMSPGLHWTILAAVALAMTASLWRGLLEFRRPHRADALRQIEKASGLKHQPLSAYEDSVATGTGDGELWAAHRSWINERLKKLHIGWPEPGVSAMDPLALRAAVMLFIVVAFYGSGPGRIERLNEALVPGLGAFKTLTIEAWITPPAYTGIAPLYLDKPDDAADKAQMTSPVSMPAGSVLSIRVHGLKNPPALDNNGPSREHPELLNEIANHNFAIEAKLVESADFALTQSGRLIRTWPITIISDTKPEIALIRPIEESTRGAVHFTYSLSDDYGIASAEALIALDKTSRLPVTLQNKSLHAMVMPKVTAPHIALSLPELRTTKGTGETFVDLSAHPWAGLPVMITLSARDDVGQQGLSKPAQMILPTRKFTQPLARAIIEQRQRLALDPQSVASVARFLDDFSRDGDKYINDKTVYLTLRAAYWRLTTAKRDEDLTGIYDLLWSIALHIEDGDTSLAESDLRKARDDLANALKEGADAEKIDRLMADLKNAFNRYMEALAEQAARLGENMLQTPFSPQNMQTIERSQLEEMMKQIEMLAGSGSREQAEAMLKQMQSILENMQTPQQAGTMSEGEQAMSEAVEKMGDLIDQQKHLMDETFRMQSDDAGKNNGTVTTGQQSAQGRGESGDMSHLKTDQKALREELEALLRQLGDKGAETPDALAKAAQSMKNAEQRIETGRADRATAAQGQAIDQMRAGAQGLADKLMQSMAGRMGNANGKGMTRTDPLGRPMPNGAAGFGEDVAVPDKIDAQRARDILEELRERATKLGRPKIELDYIDRLLKRF